MSRDSPFTRCCLLPAMISTATFTLGTFLIPTGPLQPCGSGSRHSCDCSPLPPRRPGPHPSGRGGGRGSPRRGGRCRAPPSAPSPGLAALPGQARRGRARSGAARCGRRCCAAGEAARRCVRACPPARPSEARSGPQGRCLGGGWRGQGELLSACDGEGTRRAVAAPGGPACCRVWVPQRRPWAWARAVPGEGPGRRRVRVPEGCGITGRRWHTVGGSRGRSRQSWDAGRAPCRSPAAPRGCQALPGCEVLRGPCSVMPVTPCFPSYRITTR